MIADLHVHTRCSFDSLSKPGDIVRAARRKEVDVIAVTDHNTTRGAFEVKRVAHGSGLSVVIGEEIATDEGDLVGLFLGAEIKPGSFAEVAAAVRGQGGILLLPHPFRGHSNPETLMQAVDAVEVFNARTKAADNDRAVELVAKSGKPGISVSDAHFATEVGNAVIRFSGNGLKSTLLRGEFSLSRGYNPPCLFPMSQLIKALKQGKYSRLPRQAGWFFTGLGKIR